MTSSRKEGLLTLSFVAVTITLATVLICQRFEQQQVIPLHSGHVLIRNGAVVIEDSGSVPPTDSSRGRAL
jgi:hypothetical protein